MKYYVVESRYAEGTLGCQNWLDIVTPSKKKAEAMLSRLKKCKSIQSKTYETDVNGVVMIIEEIIERPDLKDKRHPKAHSWEWGFKLVSRKGLVEYLNNLKRQKWTDPDEDNQYCLIQPMGREFVSPCPGHDMMGLMDHDHVDDGYLDLVNKYARTGKVPKKGTMLYRLLRGRPEAYARRAIKTSWWQERISRCKVPPK